MTSTGAGHVGVVMYATLNASSTTLSGVNGGSWTIPAGCHIHSASVGDIGCAYTASLTGGTTSIQVTWSSATPGSFCEFYFFEYSYTGASVALDTGTSGGVGTVNDSSASTSLAGVALTLAGSTDVIVQALGTASNTPSSISVYANFSALTFFASANLLNTGSGAAPTWTNGASSVAIGSAIALTEAPASSSVHELPLTGAGT